jgi:ankyrin repeat protein
VNQDDKRTLLQIVGHCAATIKDILGLFLDEERKKLIRQGDHNGENLLHINHDNKYLEAFRTLLSFFTIDEAPDALRQTDNQGNTVLHKVARDYYPLVLLLNTFSGIKDIIRQVNKRGNTVLHEAAGNSDTLKILLAYLLSEPEIHHDIKQVNHNGKTVLHCAVNNKQSFAFVLSLHHEEEWPDALKQMDKFGNTVLHDAAVDNHIIIKNVLARYPKKVGDDLLGVKNKKGQSLLQYSSYLVNKPYYALKKILPLYRKHQHKVGAVEAMDKKGRTVLHLVSYCKKSIKIILALYPNQEKQLEAIERMDEKDLTVLHYSAM